MESCSELENYTEEEIRLAEEEARIEAREAHRKVMGWIADVEEILASDRSSAKLKDRAEKFLVAARRVAEWQRKNLAGGNQDGDGHEFLRDFYDMLRFLDEFNETLADEERLNIGV